MTKILQGSYCQTFTERKIKNDLKQRTLDTLFLAPMKNKQGGYVMLNLATNKEVASTRITQVPITDVIIQTVEELAAQDGMTPLKIENRTGTMIYNNDMLPGIDYEEDVKPATAGHDPTYVPRRQRSYDNEISNECNFAPIDLSKLDDLWANADAFLPARLPRRRTAADAGDAPVPAPTRRSPLPPPVTTYLGRSLRITRLTPAHNQVLTVPTPKQVRIATTLAKIEYSHDMVPLPVHHSLNYSTELASVFAQLIFNINCGVRHHSASFAQQFIFQKGRKIFGKHGDHAAFNEFDQLQHSNCFTPIDLSKLMPLEKKKAQASMVLLSEKKDGTVKGRCVYEGSKTQPCFTKEETASPTALTEGIFITTNIDAHEERDVMTTDIPNAFIQASLNNLKDGTLFASM